MREILNAVSAIRFVFTFQDRPRETISSVLRRVGFQIARPCIKRCLSPEIPCTRFTILRSRSAYSGSLFLISLARTSQTLRRFRQESLFASFGIRCLKRFANLIVWPLTRCSKNAHCVETWPNATSSGLDNSRSIYRWPPLVRRVITTNILSRALSAI